MVEAVIIIFYRKIAAFSTGTAIRAVDISLISSKLPVALLAEANQMLTALFIHAKNSIKVICILL